MDDPFRSIMGQEEPPGEDTSEADATLAAYHVSRDPISDGQIRHTTGGAPLPIPAPPGPRQIAFGPALQEQRAAGWPLYTLIILDCEGTVCRTRSGATFRKSAGDWEVIPGVAEELGRVRALRGWERYGDHIAMATNQGGVAYGYTRAGELLDHILDLAAILEIPVDLVRVDFTHPKGAKSQYRRASHGRKPAPGMIQDLLLAANAPAPRALVVGDLAEDQQAAAAAGCGFLWAWQFFGWPAPEWGMTHGRVEGSG